MSDPIPADLIPAEGPHDLASSITLDRARLLELLDGLDRAGWDRPTSCPGWSVLDLATHLLGDDLGYLAGHRDAHVGDRAPEGDDEGAFIDWLDRVQDDWVRATRRVSPRLVVDLLRWTGPQLVGVVAAEDPAERVAEVSWAGRGSVPRWLDHARELSERWIHRQQILAALGSSADLRPDLLVPVLDALRWAYPFRLQPQRRPAGSVVAIVIEGTLAGPGWRLRSDGTRWSFAGSGAEELATLSMTEDQAWRLLTNNLDADRDGRPSASGDPEIVAALLATRAIIGRPSPLS